MRLSEVLRQYWFDSDQNTIPEVWWRGGIFQDHKPIRQSSTYMPFHILALRLRRSHYALPLSKVYVQSIPPSMLAWMFRGLRFSMNAARRET